MKYLLILLLLTVTASARIGETMKQCEKRYGRILKLTPLLGLPDAHQYKKGKWEVNIVYLNNICVSITYRKLSKGDIDFHTQANILKSNLPRAVFKKAQGGFLSTDAKYFYSYTESTNLFMVMHLTSLTDYQKRNAAQETKGL